MNGYHISNHVYLYDIKFWMISKIYRYEKIGDTLPTKNTHLCKWRQSNIQSGRPYSTCDCWAFLDGRISIRLHSMQFNCVRRKHHKCTGSQISQICWSDVLISVGDWLMFDRWKTVIFLSKLIWKYWTLSWDSSRIKIKFQTYRNSLPIDSSWLFLYREREYIEFYRFGKRFSKYWNSLSRFL